MAPAERAVVADARHRVRRRRLRGADRVPLVAAVGGAGGAGHRPPGGADERGPVVDLGVRVWQLALLAEDEPAAVVRGGVRQVVARVGQPRWDVVEPPRIGGHQLGVRIDHHGRGALAATGVRELEAEEHRAPAVGRVVGALHAQAGGVGEVHLRVAPAAVEAGGRSDPLAVDAEPDAVDELQRRRPDAAHLARDVPAVGVEPAVLEADGIGALAGDEGTAVLQPVGDGELGRSGGCRRRQQGGQPHSPSNGTSSGAQGAPPVP